HTSALTRLKIPRISTGAHRAQSSAPTATATATATAVGKFIWTPGSTNNRSAAPLVPALDTQSSSATKKIMALAMPPPSQVYLCKLCYAEHTNIHSARNHMCDDHSLNLSTADTWGYVSVTNAL
ncbi:hypothetical protein GGI24_001943, partial [Coemansia furcata]